MSPRAGPAAGSLRVFWGGVLVGKLSLDASRRMSFRYDDNWLDRASARPLSVSLPLRMEPYADDFARPFFANLLPEADVRAAIARRLGISEENDFGLLERLGRECAGAVSLWPAGSRPPSRRGTGQKVSRDELAAMISNLPRLPLLQARAGLRLSLAGAQEKLPVLWDGAEVSISGAGSPSTHIVKPPIRGFEGTVENEAFCMRPGGRDRAIPSGGLLPSAPPPPRPKV